MSITNHNDKELFRQIARGDEEAFKTIFHAYNKKLYPFILSFVKITADAKEIVQEVFLKLWLKRETLTTIENPSSWLHTVAVNAAYIHLRREARYALRLKTVIDSSAPQPCLEDIFEEFDRKNVKALIADAVSQLPLRRRQVFQMSRFEGRSRKEIADELGISENTVRNHLVDAVSFIQDYIRKFGLLNLFAILIQIEFHK